MTEFHSAPPPASDAPDPVSTETYLDQLYAALAVSIEAAKTPLAKLSKILLRERLKKAASVRYLKMAEVDLNTSSLRMVHLAGTLPLALWSSDEILGALNVFLDDVEKQVSGKHIFLVDSLLVDIRYTLPDVHTYSWKLRFAVPL